MTSRAGFAFVTAVVVLALTGARGVVGEDQKDKSEKEATKSSEAALRRRSANNLKQLGLAMHNYHDVNRSFPPAAIYDKAGKPLLSWRVLLLPFLGEQKLAEQFHLDESWDSEHNIKLLNRMPAAFRLPYPDAKPGETPYVGFSGKDTLFEGKKGIKLSDITDGTSVTLMFVESATPVPWTKPVDLPYDPDKPLPKLGLSASGFSAAFCDGSVRFFNPKVSEKTIRGVITRNGGEVIPNF